MVSRERTTRRQQGAVWISFSRTIVLAAEGLKARRGLLVDATGTLPDSRHPPRLTPSLERGPQPAVEPEAIDRRRGGDGADASQHYAAPLEAALLEHAARGRVRDACVGLESVETQIAKGVIDQRARGFGGEALAPIGHAQPVADLGGVVPVALEAAAADERAVGERDGKRDFAGARFNTAQEILGIGERVGVRHARGVLGNATVVGEPRHGAGVRALQGAQAKPLGFEGSWNAIVSAIVPDVWPPLQECHRGPPVAHVLSCAEKRRGEPASRLPSWKPAWVPPDRLMPANPIWSTVYSAAACDIGCTDTKTRPLALVRNST